MDPVIEAMDATYEYPDGTNAIKDVSLTIESGERVAVVGPNGSGKSTLQLVLGGLVEPTAGSVRYFGETDDAESVRDRLGVLLQDPDDYLFNTTVREDIEYGPAQLDVPRAAAASRIGELATVLGLTDLLERPPFRLSGGEKQRAAVASVFSFNPDVLLLDEPFGAVDAGFSERISSLLDKHGGTSVIFTPSLDRVPLVADRVVLIGKNGSIKADGTVRDVLTDIPLLTKHGLRPPVTVELFEGLSTTNQIPLTVLAARRTLMDEFSE